MKLEYFEPWEFSCNCGTCGLGFDEMQPDLLFKLDDARHYADEQFIVTSAVRCEAYNATVGGVDSSAHVNGWAVDIATPTSRSRFKVLKGLIDAGFERLGIASDFIHADCDPDKAPEVSWLYE